MTSITETSTTLADVISSVKTTPAEDATKSLLSNLESQCLKPLWAQMSKLNPPKPNPTCIPHIWEYDKIRPHLLQAGELITEKQAERRVAMLVNPARGKWMFSYIKYALNILPIFNLGRILLTPFRCPVYHRHHLRRSPAGYAERNCSSSQTYCLCHALHH
jgi:gentisate 1,2-dioxygenase